MEVGFKTDKGIRRSNNEDAYFVMLKERVFIVADGVGGNNSGEIASRSAVNEVAKYIEEYEIDENLSSKEIINYFDECIKSVNYRVLELSHRFEQNKGMATTLVVGYLTKKKMYIFNVGDSRAYLFRKGKLEQITIDHTYVNSLIDAGLISEQEAESHEKKHMITRAIGADYTVDADAFELKPKVGDIVLMCTDGLHGEVSEEEIVEILSKERAIGEICDMLIERANQNGGGDNITLVCLKITEEDL